MFLKILHGTCYYSVSSARRLGGRVGAGDRSSLEPVPTSPVISVCLGFDIFFVELIVCWKLLPCVRENSGAVRLIAATSRGQLQPRTTLTGIKQVMKTSRCIFKTRFLIRMLKKSLMQSGGGVKSRSDADLLSVLPITTERKVRALQDSTAWQGEPS